MTTDYNKISQIVQQYQTKYTKDLSTIKKASKNIGNFR
jgi:hypothetical protein